MVRCWVGQYKWYKGWEQECSVATFREEETNYVDGENKDEKGGKAGSNWTHIFYNSKD